MCGSPNRLPLSLNWSARRCRTSGFSCGHQSPRHQQTEFSLDSGQQGGACQRRPWTICPGSTGLPSPETEGFLDFQTRVSSPLHFRTDPILIIPWEHEQMPLSKAFKTPRHQPPPPEPQRPGPCPTRQLIPRSIYLHPRPTIPKPQKLWYPMFSHSLQ